MSTGNGRGAPKGNSNALSHGLVAFKNKRRRARSLIDRRNAGETFRQDFQGEGISYKVSELTKSEIYEEFEPLCSLRCMIAGSFLMTRESTILAVRQKMLAPKMILRSRP